MNKHALTDEDIKLLAASFISIDLARSAGLFRVDSPGGAELVGRNGTADYSGIVFPYSLPGKDHPREYRLRRYNPDLEHGPDGEIKQKGKYLSPPGRRNLLYFVPMTDAGWLADTNLPICLTEGEKKALALWELAWRELSDAALLPRFLPVGLSGVWNWRGKVGKAEGDRGQRLDVKGVIPDFDLITWQGRTAYVVFDTNVRANESVQAARRGLAAELKRRGADVLLIDLPEVEGVNGVDDLLALKGPDYVSALFDAAEPAEGREAKRQSQASALVRVADGAELFHTGDGDCYATIPVKGHRETWSLRSRGFRDWLSKRYYESEGAIPNSQATQDALNTLQGVARHDGPQAEVHTRLAARDGRIWLDLCDEGWRAVEISVEGWKVVSDAPIKFRRTRGMRPLPIPLPGASVSYLRPFVNVTDPDWVLLVSWLAAAFRPGYPFPVLVVHGEQGSAKSTVSKMLRELIDPNVAPLRSVQRDERDLMLAATNGWVVALDNLSNLPVWLSDAICRLSTGGGFATRTLYENDEETIFTATRPVIINGIEELATRSDLLDRSLIVHLPPIPPDKRKTEAEVRQEFERLRPYVLGGLLDAVCHAMRNAGEVRLERKPRMADFAVWAAAAEGSFGWEPGTFMSAYTGNREGANELALESSSIGASLIEFARQQGRWEGTATELLEELNRIASDEAKRQPGWPKRPNALSGAVKRIAPNLRAVGVEAVFRERSKARRRITLEYRGETSSPSSPSSPSTGNDPIGDRTGDGRGDGDGNEHAF